MEIKELGHLVLYVRDLDRSTQFYREALGWRQILGDVDNPLPFRAAAFSAPSGRTHHELLLMKSVRMRRPSPQADASACTTSG